MRLFSQEARERSKRLNRTRPMRRAAWFGGAALVFVVLYFLALYVVLSPPFTGWLWQSAMEDASPARGLLTGYRRWYRVLLAVCGGGIAVNALLFLIQLVLTVWNIRTYRRLWREEVIPKLAEIERWDMVSLEEKVWHRGRVLELYDGYSLAALLLICSAVLCIIAGAFCWAVFDGENLAALPRQAREDLVQMETGSLETLEVWLSPNSSPGRLPGPYSSGQPTLVTRYGAIGEDTSLEWVTVRVPNALNFSLDSERLFDETQTAAWNRDHAQRYQIFYTSNFHLVTGITPVT